MFVPVVRGGVAVALAVALLSGCPSDSSAPAPSPPGADPQPTPAGRDGRADPAARLLPACPPGPSSTRPTSAAEINRGIAI